MESQQNNDENATSYGPRLPAKTSQCIDWYAEGEERIVAQVEQLRQRNPYFYGTER